MTLFDGIHLAHVTVLQQIKKTCVTELLLLGFLLYLREIPSISPRGLIFRGEIKWKGFRHYVFGGGGGSYIWRGLYIMVSCRLFRQLLVRIGEGKRNCESELISMSRTWDKE